MSTAATKPTKSLDSTQRAWLKKMGAALDVKVADAAKQSPHPTSSGSGPEKSEPKSEADEKPTPSVAGKPLLKAGSCGQDVKDAQTLLNKNGADLKVDGDFGPLTTQAVKHFQSSNPPLKVDGIIGTQTWTALAAGKKEPPKPSPPDTKPRKAVFIVTDTATNNAIENASVKLAEETEKTGNTGQATLSLSPGRYPYGVTADGYEQAIGTFEVTSNDVSQLHVELKRGKLNSKTVLNVSPSGQSSKGDKIVLNVTVIASDGKASLSGTIRFDVLLNQGSGGRLTLAKVPLKDGKASHAETKLPKGSHLLDASYISDTPTSEGSQSDPVKHDVVLSKQDDYEVARKTAIAKMDDCMVSAREFNELAKDRKDLEKAKKDMEASAKAGDFVKAKELAKDLGTKADAYLKKSSIQEEKYKKKGEVITKQLDGASDAKRGEVAATIANDLKGKSDEIKFMPTKVRNRLLQEMQKGGLTDDEKKASRVLYSETYLDPEFEKIDKANQEKMFAALKGDPAFKEARSKWNDPGMTAEKKLAILQKVCDHQAKAYGFPPGKVTGYDRTKEPSRPKYGYYSHKDGKMYVNIEKAVLTDEGIDESIDTAVHEHAHRYQSWLVDRLDGKEKPELKEGDPLYNEAVTFKLNDTKQGFYVFDGAEYAKQPKEHHSRLTHDLIKDAGIGK